MDGTTDAGKIEDKFIVIMTFCKDDAIGEVKSSARYFSVEEPKKAHAEGLIASLQKALRPLGFDNELNKSSVIEGKTILISGGTDGASVKISGHNGIKGIMKRELPWLFWAWCYAHRLELACKKSSYCLDRFLYFSASLLQVTQLMYTNLLECVPPSLNFMQNTGYTCTAHTAKALHLYLCIC